MSFAEREVSRDWPRATLSKDAVTVSSSVPRRSTCRHVFRISSCIHRRMHWCMAVVSRSLIALHHIFVQACCHVLLVWFTVSCLPCMTQYPSCIYGRSETGARQLKGACPLAACSPTCMVVRYWATLHCILSDAPLREAGDKLSVVSLTLMLVNGWLGAGPQTLTKASCSVAFHLFRMAIVGHSSPKRSQ